MGSAIGAKPLLRVDTVSNSCDCKRQLSRRHLLPDSDSGIDQMGQGENPVERFAVLSSRRFLP